MKIFNKKKRQEKHLEKYATLAETPYINRQHKERKGKSSRNAFQKDRDRIAYTRAFRRLMHKTQVFIRPKGDHFRTRLTHTLEVSQIARSIARSIGVDEDLTEAIALAHDLGHPPFGHAGEDELEKFISNNNKGTSCFDHNVQTFRLVTKLEFIGHEFDGLNLTIATLEGLLKHHTVEERKKSKEESLMSSGRKKSDEDNLKYFFPAIKRFAKNFDFYKPAGLEAQCACIADDIAYNHHDLEDGLRSEYILIKDVRNALPHIEECYKKTSKESPHIDDARKMRGFISNLLGDTIEDVITTTRKNLKNIHSLEDVQNQEQEIVCYSETKREEILGLKKYLNESLYNCNAIKEEKEKACEILKILMTELPKKLSAWDSKFREAYNSAQESSKKRRVLTDYIAGMTDNYASNKAEELHRKNANQ